MQPDALPDILSHVIGSDASAGSMDAPELVERKRLFFASKAIRNADRYKLSHGFTDASTRNTGRAGL